MPGPRTKGTPGEHEFGGQPGNEGLLSTLRSFYWLPMESGCYPKGISHENSFSIQNNAGKLGPETVKGSESKLMDFLPSWEMLGMWGKLMEMSTMLASIVLFMFFFPPQRLLKIGPKWGWSCYQPNESGQIWRAVVWRTARDQMIWDVWNILKYTYIIIYYI